MPVLAVCGAIVSSQPNKRPRANPGRTSRIWDGVVYRGESLLGCSFRLSRRAEGVAVSHFSGVRTSRGANGALVYAAEFPCTMMHCEIAWNLRYGDFLECWFGRLWKYVKSPDGKWEKNVGNRRLRQTKSPHKESYGTLVQKVPKSNTRFPYTRNIALIVRMRNKVQKCFLQKKSPVGASGSANAFLSIINHWPCAYALLKTLLITKPGFILHPPATEK